MGPAKCSDDHFEREWRRYDIAMRQALMHACAQASEAALEASCRPGEELRLAHAAAPHQVPQHPPG